MAGRRATRPYHHGDLRRTLLDAALALVSTLGPGALSLRELAREAGVSHAAPYRHFESREALLVALAIEGFTGLAAEMAGCAADPADPIAHLRAIGLAYVRYAVSHPGHFRIMFSSELHEGNEDPLLAEAAQPTLAVLVEAISAAQRQGQVRAGDPRALALPAWSMVHGLSMLLVDRQVAALLDQVEAETLAHTVLDVTMRGLAPSPSPAGPSRPRSRPPSSGARRRSS